MWGKRYCRAPLCAVVLLVPAVLVAQAPRLGIEGDRFTVNGTPKFLLFASYFDAMRRPASGVDADLRYIASKGYDGVRIFPNWWHVGCAQPEPGAATPATVRTAYRPANDDGLFTPDATIREPRWKALVERLDSAAARGLVVDVSFSRESVTAMVNGRDQPLPFDRYKPLLVEVVTRLKGAHPHVFIDLQNEFSLGHLSDEQAADLVKTVKAADPARIVTVSTHSNISPEQAGRKAKALGSDVAAVHDGRGPGWHEQVPTVVAAAKRGTRDREDGRLLPIYLQEPMPFRRLYRGTAVCASLEDRESGHARAAAAAAKASGAAAWTFHTRSNFDMTLGAYERLMDADEREEFEAIRLAVAK